MTVALCDIVVEKGVGAETGITAGNDTRKGKKASLVVEMIAEVGVGNAVQVKIVPKIEMIDGVEIEIDAVEKRIGPAKISTKVAEMMGAAGSRTETGNVILIDHTTGIETEDRACTRAIMEGALVVVSLDFKI